MARGRWISAIMFFGCTLGGAQACAFWELSDLSTPEGSDAGSLEASADDRQSATATGLGSADSGGAWTLGTTASTYAVQDGTARFTVDAAKSIESYLLDVSALDVDATVSFATSIGCRSNGSAPSHLRGRTWMDGTAEPSTWDIEASDSTVALQSAGAVGLAAYVSFHRWSRRCELRQLRRRPRTSAAMRLPVTPA